MGLSEAAFALLEQMLEELSAVAIGPIIGQPDLVFQADNARELKAVALIQGLVSGAISAGPRGGSTTGRHTKACGALKALLERCEISVEGGSDAECEVPEGELDSADRVAQAGPQGLVVDVNDLLTIEDDPGIP